MVTRSTGTLDGDVIRLDAPLDLPQSSRVELTVQPLAAPDARWAEFLDELDALGNDQPIGSGGTRLTRDELHERR